MDTKKLVLGTLAGGVAYFFLGFIIYAILMEDFFASHTVKGIMKSETEMKYYPLVAGNLAHAALLSFIFLKWANINPSVADYRRVPSLVFLWQPGLTLLSTILPK